MAMKTRTTKQPQPPRKNLLFAGAKILLRDGTELKETNPRTLRSIIHHQLHTHERKFTNKVVKPPVAAAKPKKEASFKEVMGGIGNVVVH